MKFSVTIEGNSPMEFNNNINTFINALNKHAATVRDENLASIPGIPSETIQTDAIEPNIPAIETAALETVIAKATEFGKAKGGRALKAVLENFGIDKVTDLRPNEYGFFLSQLELATVDYRNLT